jgi:hypothetical protein
MTSTANRAPWAQAIVDWLATGVLNAEAAEAITTILREQEDKLVRAGGAEVGSWFSEPDVRRRFGVPEHAFAGLVMEKAGYPVDTSYAWLAASALDETTGSTWREDLRSRWGESMLGIDRWGHDDDARDSEDDD